MRFTSQSDIPRAEFLNTREQVAEVCDYFARTPGPLGFDTETSGLDYDGLFVDCFCVGLANHERRVVIPTYSGAGPLWGDGAGNLETLLPFLADTQHRHAGYNWIYDVNVLYGYTRWKLRQRPFQLHTCWADGVKLFCHFDEEGEDTYGVRRLKDRCRYWLGLPMNDFDKIVQGHGFGEALHDNFDLSVDYAARDAWGHLGLALLGQQVTEQMPWCSVCPECGDYCFHQNPANPHQWMCLNHGWVSGGDMKTMWDWHVELDIPFLHCLQKMQVRGLPMDWDYLSSAVEPTRTALDRAEEAFHREVNAALQDKWGKAFDVQVNLRSDAQLRKVYHEETDAEGTPVGLGLPAYGYTDSGSASMSSDNLRKLMVKDSAPGVLPLLEHRKLEKILKAYVLGMQKRRFDETGRLHGSFRPTTTTGRLRSADPNMQNFPTKTLTVTLPPVAPYVPTVGEMMTEWGLTKDQAEQELELPEYQPRVTEVNIRKAVSCPSDVRILCADFSQLEIRLTALDSKCTALVKVLNEGLDMHCYAAARAFASALVGAEYEDIYEAKQADDGDMGPRHRSVLRLVDDLAAVEKVRGCRAEPTKVLQLREHIASELATALEPTEEGVARLKDENPALYGACLDLLGLRDKELLGLRKSAKSAIFGIIYGIGPTKLAADITEATGEVFSVADAKALITSIKDEVFPGIGRMVERQKQTLKNRGYVRTAMGRYRHPAGVFSGNSGKRAKAERQSTNSPIQGLAADVVQRAMLAIDTDDELRELGALLLSQVHDELIMEVPAVNADAALDRMKHLMETAHRLYTPVPLTVTGHAALDWNEAK